MVAPMNDSPIRSGGNPFLRAAAEIKATGAITRPVAPEKSEAPRKSPRARLNYLPEDSELSGMIDRALGAMSRGIHWVRGSIVNLLV